MNKNDSEDLDQKLDEKLSSIVSKLDRQYGTEGNFRRGYHFEDQNDLYLRNFVILFWVEKKIILITLILSIIMALVVAFGQAKVYQAEAILAPSEESQGGGISALAGKLGGLATLAGVNYSGGEVDKSAIAIETIKSRSFLMGIIDRYDLLASILAAKGWDERENRILYDKKIYDEDKNIWHIKGVNGKSMPTLWEGYRVFSKMLSVTQNKKNSLVTVSIQYWSPEVSKQWVDLIVKEINETMKSRDVIEASQSIKYLEEKMNSTSITGMQSVFGQLIEEQTKTMMLAEVRSEYAFTTLDPAIIPEKSIKPKKILILAAGIFAGFLLGVTIVLIKVSLFAPLNASNSYRDSK